MVFLDKHPFHNLWKKCDRDRIEGIKFLKIYLPSARILSHTSPIESHRENIPKSITIMYGLWTGFLLKPKCFSITRQRKAKAKSLIITGYFPMTHFRVKKIHWTFILAGAILRTVTGTNRVNFKLSHCCCKGSDIFYRKGDKVAQRLILWNSFVRLLHLCGLK